MFMLNKYGKAVKGTEKVNTIFLTNKYEQE